MYNILCSLFLFDFDAKRKSGTEKEKHERPNGTSHQGLCPRTPILSNEILWLKPQYDENKTMTKKENNMNQAKEMARIAYEALSEKKGEDIKVIDISGISVLADYFLIAHGNSDSQVNALVENVEEQLHKAGYPLKEREGQASGKWVLMDFGDVIIHVFDRENRLFYNLERIWKDGKEIPAEEL